MKYDRKDMKTLFSKGFDIFCYCVVAFAALYFIGSFILR